MLVDENEMTAVMMGFPTLHAILREVPTMFSANLLNQYSSTHYLDIAQQFGIPGDVCPMPEAEAGASIEDDFPVLGKWDWKAYFECAKRVNETTRNRLTWLEVNSTPYPQFIGATFSLYNDTNYMGNCGRSPLFPPIDRKIMKYVQRGYERKTMMAPEYRHRCIVWGVQPQYVIDMLNWMVHCWGVVPLTDMLSMVISKEIAEEDTPENREQAYYDMAYLTENMIMRNRTHGGYKVLVDELWEFCEKMNADMVMMWEHMSCKALVGMHGQFEEQARERGIHLVWVCHDLCDPRVYSRQAIRDQFNEYMRTVMREEPLDPSIEVLPDENAW